MVDSPTGLGSFDVCRHGTGGKTNGDVNLYLAVVISQAFDKLWQTEEAGADRPEAELDGLVAELIYLLGSGLGLE